MRTSQLFIPATASACVTTAGLSDAAPQGHPDRGASPGRRPDARQPAPTQEVLQQLASIRSAVKGTLTRQGRKSTQGPCGGSSDHFEIGIVIGHGVDPTLVV